MTAGRVRDLCIREMHGDAGAGASLLPALAHEMQEKGHFAKVHYADLQAMVKTTAVVSSFFWEVYTSYIGQSIPHQALAIISK